MTTSPQPMVASPGFSRPGDARGDDVWVRGEQTRARYPDAEGYLDRDGVRVFYEAYGAGEPTILLLPSWEITHSRAERTGGLSWFRWRASTRPGITTWSPGSGPRSARPPADGSAT